MKDSIRNWLTEQFGADDALLTELYDQYAQEMKASAAEIETLLAASDVAALGERGHAMKGMALQIGDADLSDPCKRLQDAGRAGNLSDCAALVPQICAAVAAL